MTSARGGAPLGRAGFTSEQVVTAITLVTLITVIAFEAMSISTVMPDVGYALRAEGAYGLAFSAMFTAQLFGIVLAGTAVAARGSLGAVMLGQVLFAAGSALAGSAPEFGTFLFGRAVAGLGAGLVIVAVYTIIGAVFAERHRPVVFAWLSSAWVLPSIVGPLVAAWLAQAVTWRAVFWVVVPFVAVTLVLLWRRRCQVSEAGVDPAAGGHIDGRTVGAGMLIGLGAASVQAGGTALVPPSFLPVVSVVLGAVVLAVVLPRTLPAGTFTLAAGVPSVVASRFFHSGGFNSCVAFVPLFLVTATGMGLAQAGLVLAISSITWAAGAAVQGAPRMAGRQTRLVVAGALCCLAAYVGYAVFAFVPAAFPGTVAASGWWLLLAGGVNGLGMGLSTASLSVLVFAFAPPDQHASASSSLQLGDVLGSALGLTVAGVLFATMTAAREVPSGVVDPVPYASIWAFTAALAVGAVVSGVRIRGR